MSLYNTAALYGGFAPFSDVGDEYSNKSALRTAGKQIIDNLMKILPVTSQASIDWVKSVYTPEVVEEAAGYVYAMDSARQHIFFAPTWGEQDTWKNILRTMKQNLKLPANKNIKALIPKFTKYLHLKPSITEAEWQYLEDQNAPYVPSGAYRFLPNVNANYKGVFTDEEKLEFAEKIAPWTSYLAKWKEDRGIVSGAKKKSTRIRMIAPKRGKKPKRGVIKVTDIPLSPDLQQAAIQEAVTPPVRKPSARKIPVKSGGVRRGTSSTSSTPAKRAREISWIEEPVNPADFLIEPESEGEGEY